MKCHDGSSGFNGPLQQAPAAGECFLGEKVHNRIPVEPLDQDGVQYCVNRVNERLSLRRNFEGHVAGSMTGCSDCTDARHHLCLTVQKVKPVPDWRQHGSRVSKQQLLELLCLTQAGRWLRSLGWCSIFIR